MAEYVECPNCGYGLEADWAVCPRCGQRLTGSPNQEMMTQILTKVIIGLVEAGLAQMEAEAKKRGNDIQARQISNLARSLAKELGPVAAEQIVHHSNRLITGARARRQQRMAERRHGGRGITRGAFGTRRGAVGGRGGGVRRGRAELEEEEYEEEGE
jgi:DNA-directed RNA polymerase subunit RPC12/RpoP